MPYISSSIHGIKSQTVKINKGHQLGPLIRA